MIFAIIYFGVLLVFWFCLRDELNNNKDVEEDED